MRRPSVKHMTLATTMMVMLAPPASLMAQAADESMTRLLDSAIDSAIDENRVVGAVVLVSHDGELVYHRAAGMADTAAGITMTEDTIFRLSSLSKPIVTAAAMRLVDDGILDLDAPVTDWLPDFRPGFDGETPVITLRQLLSHTSGVSYRGFEFGSGPYTDAGVQDGAFGTGITLEENVTRIATAPLTFEPGTGWGYGLGVDVIGRVIEVATNLPLEVAVRDLVTGPLGMSATGFHVPVWEESRLSVSYRDAENGPVAMSDHEWVPFAGTVAKVLFEPPRATDPDAWPSAGAGMSGTPPDFLELLETFRPAQSFFSDEALMAMYQPVAGEDAASNGPGWGFGIGGAILIDPEKSGTPQPEGTFSWSGAYGHTWFIDPENNLVVVAMTNTTWEGMSGQFSIDIRNAVYGN